MKILVFEYVTAAGLAEAPSGSLLAEGEVMLAALLADLTAIPGVEVLALRDRRLPWPGSANSATEWVWVEPARDGLTCLAATLPRVDAVWPIAPETGGILESICRTVEQAGKALLSTPAAGVRLAASKYVTFQRLQAHGVPVVPTERLESGNAALLPFSPPCVVKPDDGAGCEATWIVGSPADWDGIREQLVAGTNWIVQPLIEGESLSLSAVFSRGHAMLWTVNRQHIVEEGHGFRLEGCGVNAMEDSDRIFADLARRVAAAVPELWGYAGIDLIRNEAGLHVLEINPRLTSSYAGLQSALGGNPAASVLALWRSGSLPDDCMPPGRAVEIDWGLDQ
jgi:predicted ATP-grasp superfamily ATP-dependent carboligase